MKKTRVIIKADRITLQGESGGTAYSETYKLTIDPKRTPKTFEMKGERKAFDGVRLEETLLGIYSLKGDELKLCKFISPKVLKERPAEFKTRKGDRTALWIFKRVVP